MATKTSDTSEFNFPKRADPARIKSGVKRNMKDEFQQSWGVFTFGFMDSDSVRGRQQMIAATNQYREKIDSGELPVEKMGIKVFCEHYLFDWEIPVEIWNDNGQPVKFTPENAEKFLSHDATEWLADKLVNMAQDIRNFGYLTDSKGKATDAKN